MWRELRTWGWLGLLLPVLLACWLLDGLSLQLLTFHGTDETLYHLPAIRQMAADWPRPNLSDYTSATTPLFHVLYAAVEWAWGEHLPWMRALNVLTSLFASLLFARLLQAYADMDATLATGFGVAFGLSPYFFGASFILLTDNLGWMLALAALLAARHGAANTLRWAMACVCLTLALLTRQTHVWLLPCFLWLVWRTPEVSVPTKARASAWMAATLLPLLGLFHLWGGVVPPGFQDQHEAARLLNLRAVQFMLCTTGFYWLMLVVPVRGLQGLRWFDVIGAAAVGAAWMAWQPLAPGYGTDGFLWQAARGGRAWPTGIWLFWVLMPLGCVALWQMLRTSPVRIGAIGWLAYALVMSRSELLYQKYFDPMVPMLLICGMSWANVSRWRVGLGLGVWSMLGVVYTIEVLIRGVVR